jgi:hypothetical protein
LDSADRRRKNSELVQDLAGERVSLRWWIFALNVRRPGCDPVASTAEFSAGFAQHPDYPFSSGLLERML